tara:strand:+ start:11506 stop:12117 length:612 start_codon:yes stop_codon:yes gene_type:complete
MRARMALYYSGQSCVLREVILRNKPPEMIEASPKGTVPVLILKNGSVIEQSLEIMYWALEQHDPEDWLTPFKDDNSAQNLVSENDGPFKNSLDRYKYPNRYQNCDPLYYRSTGEEFLVKINERLMNTKYLFGDSFSFVDAAISPFIRQFANKDPEWFYGNELSATHRWLTSILESDIFLNIMKKYAVWENGKEETLFSFQSKS